MELPPGTTSFSLDVMIVDDTGLPVTGLVASTFPTVKYSRGAGNDSTISLSDLSTLSSAYSSGGVKERGEGVYRLDVPDAAIASAGVVKIRGEASGKRIICPTINVRYVEAKGPGQANIITSGTGANQIQVDGSGSLVCVTGAYNATYSILSDLPNAIWTSPIRVLTGPDNLNITSTGEPIPMSGGLVLASVDNNAIAFDVWANATRTLTSAANITSTGGVITLTGAGWVKADVQTWLGVAPLALNSQKVQSDASVTLGPSDISDIADGVVAGIGADGVGLTEEAVGEVAAAVLGTGNTAVNHNTGGTDNYRVAHSGVGVGDVTIQAYVASEYASSAITATARARTTTESDGRWSQPMMLSSGAPYVLVHEKDGYSIPNRTVTP